MKQRLPFYNISLKRMLILFLCASVALTGLLMLFSASVSRKTLESNLDKSLTLYALEQESKLAEALQNVKTTLISLSNKKEIQDYLEKNRGYKALNLNNLRSIIMDIPNYVPSISDLMLVTADRGLAAMTYNKSDLCDLIVRRDMVNRYYDEGAAGVAYFASVPKQAGNFILTMAVKINQADAALAFLTVDSLFGNLNFAQRPYAVFSQGTLIYADSEAVPAQAERTECMRAQASGGYGSWIHIPMKATQWDLWIEAPLTIRPSERENDTARWYGIVFFIFALAECALVFMIHQTMITPVTSISQQSKRINSFSTPIENPASGRNEISELVENINQMMTRANELKGEVDKARIRIMEMDILRLKERNMFLQAQINPHFLNNMLECICGMAVKEGAITIREMARLLAQMYRYCLESPESTLGEELQCLALYKKIIDLRYEMPYRFEIDCAEDLWVMPMPRMMLEPLVENSVQHGFEHGRRRDFSIRIAARLESNCLCIDISDNGCGISQEKLLALNEKLARTPAEHDAGYGSIGLCNVGARLRLVYGEQSGLTLMRNEYGGLTVRMRIRYEQGEGETV